MKSSFFAMGMVTGGIIAGLLLAVYLHNWNAILTFSMFLGFAIAGSYDLFGREHP